MFDKVLKVVWLALFAALSCFTVFTIWLLVVGKVAIAAASEPSRVSPPCITDTECCTAAEDC